MIFVDICINDCLAIFNYFKDDNNSLKASFKNGKELRYGENPHQNGTFYGDFSSMFDQLHGKELSYNNLLDVDAAVYYHVRYPI